MKADSAPATVQVMVEVRRTHTPDRRAESAFSAVARMARPQGENRTTGTRARATSGRHDQGEDLAGAMTRSPRVNDQSKGTGKGL